MEIVKIKTPVMVFLSVFSLMLLCPLAAVPTAWAQTEQLIPLSETVTGEIAAPRETASGVQKVRKPTRLIRIGETQFDPLYRIPPQSAALARIQSYAPGQTGYYIVQFDGPIQADWKDDLRRNGAEILDYLPDYAFVVRVAAQQRPVLQSMPHLRWIGIFQPGFRISKTAMGRLHSRGSGAAVETVTLRVNLFSGVDADAIEARVADIGGSVKGRTRTKLKTALAVEIPTDRIDRLPAIDGVRWVEPTPTWKLYNDVSTDIMRVRAPRDTHGLYGAGQTIGVADTGLDLGYTSPANLHDDFENGSGGSRVSQIIDRVPADEIGVDTSDVNGHGTHVAGSVLGNGQMSGSNPAADSFPATAHAGTAPKANLVFQAVEDNDSGDLSGLPMDLNTLFAEADAAGAHLHSNSWGANGGSAYTAYSQDVDEYIWSNPDFLILFAAGNDGTDLDADGIIDLYGIASPGTAKNCLTIGASEGDRPGGAGLDVLWGTADPYTYPSNPIRGDHVSDNDRGMAAFSSRGPSLDGRYKPDLVAPGTNILSTRTGALSSGSPVGWGNFNDHYAWYGGTSMATPLAAGTAALMREYLITREGFASPSAALIKAALINSAEDISPGQYGTGATQEIPDDPVPNNVEGWGRISLSDGVFPAAPFDILYYDQASGLNTGESHAYTFTVNDSSAPIKINLTWTDYPGSPSAQGGLVNDLDLDLTSPSSAIFYPDNALQASPINTQAYDTADIVVAGADNYAVRFTPSSYPAYLDSTTFWYYNIGTAANADVVVYGDDGSGLPDTSDERYRKTLTYVPTGFITIPLNLTVSSGEIHIAIERAADGNFGMGLENSNPSGRTSVSATSPGAPWSTSAYTALIRANIRYSPDFSTQYDRVNNTVGITVDTPETGIYTIRVAGQNVPFGPQDYALVVSGDITPLVSGTLAFSSSAYSVDESPMNAVITVRRSGGSDGAASVAYSSSNGTAVAGSDYTSVSGTLSWPDGDNTDRTFTVPILEDSDAEPAETINLSLSAAAGAPLGAIASAVLTINASDNPGTVNFSSPDYAVDEAAGTVTITVRRTGGSTGPASVDFATADGTAIAGDDYTAAGGTLTWADGDAADKTFTVPVLDDDASEPDETIQLLLSNAIGASLGGTGSAVLTISASDAISGAGGGATGPATTGSGGGGGGGCFIKALGR